MKNRCRHYLNEQGASIVKVIAIIIILSLLLGGAASFYFTIQDKRVKFSDSEISAAERIAQATFEEVAAVAQTNTVDWQLEALAEIGFDETRRDNMIITYERKNSHEDHYVLLKIQPHESYEHLSRVLVQVFDKEHRVLMTELSNILTWQANE